MPLVLQMLEKHKKTRQIKPFYFEKTIWHKSGLDVTLDSELLLRDLFEFTPKRFAIVALTEDIKIIFSEGVYEALPPISQFDFSEAGKCIAFSMPTAAVFHCMRGVEGALRHYYHSIVKRTKGAEPMWGQIISTLEKRRDKPSKPILDSLDNIRQNYRNPTQHPEARYDIDTAQDLLSVSIEAVNKMIKDLEARKLKKA